MDVEDNCPKVSNPDQADNELDGIGDLCDPDDDNDGVVDEEDNCPFEANEDQADYDEDGLGDACDEPPPADKDADGIPDVEDNCPDDPNEDQADSDEDGIGDACDEAPPADKDDDGVVDSEDNCPDFPNDQADLDEDGLGDLCDDDVDGDGIANEPDNCPVTANGDQADWDDDGTGDLCQGEAFGVMGGACSAAPTGSAGGRGSLLGLMILALAALVALRFRGAARASAVGLRNRSVRASGVGLLAALAALAVMGSGATASAQSAVDAQAFDVSPFQQDLFVTGKGYSREAGQWNVGLFLDYQRNPLVVKSVSSGDVVRTIIGNQLTGNALFAIAPLDWLDVGVAVPVVLYQDGDGAPGGGSPAIAGIGDIRIVPRFQLYSTDDRFFSVAVTPELTAPTGQLVDPYMGNRNFAFTPWVSLGLELPRFGVALDLGYLLTENGNVGDLALLDELRFRAGAWVGLLPDKLDLIAEAVGATAASEPFAHVNQSPLELLAGGRYHASKNVDVNVGGGVGLTEGYSSPDFRVFGGVMWHTSTEEPIVDSDGDGLLDPDDKCPLLPEDPDQFEDQDGCPDPDDDADGICDEWVSQRKVEASQEGRCRGVDACRLEKEDLDLFEDEDGCPDLDNDEDTILDVDDKCPNQAEDDDSFEDQDGCPDPDNDQDGILDAADKCLNDPETKNNFQDEDGCPDELAKVEGKKIIIMDRVYFYDNQDKIKPESFPVLDAVVDVLKKNPGIEKIRIEGHTDTRGSAAHNRALADKRSKAVLKYLVEHGIDGKRLEAKGFGEDVPLVKIEKTEEDLQKNRRVEFNILRQKTE